MRKNKSNTGLCVALFIIGAIGGSFIPDDYSPLALFKKKKKFKKANKRNPNPR